MVWSGRTERGVGELLAVVVLAVLGLAWAAVEATRRNERIEHERARAAGAVFASWMQATHRRAQEDAPFLEGVLAVEPGVALTQAELVMDGFAPEWLARETILGQSIELGVVDDGGGVPMAFAVASPSRPLSVRSAEGFRAGAAGAGVVGFESLDTELGAETFTGPRRAGMEHALGRPLTGGDWVSVADLGVVYDERVLHRRRQPGRAYLSEMRTDLSFSPGAGIRNGGIVKARTMESSSAFLVGRLANVTGDVVADEAAGQATVEAAVVHGHRAVTLTAGLDAAAWRIDGALEAGRGVADEEIRAVTIDARGLLDAGLRLAVDGGVRATGRFDAMQVSASTVYGNAPDGFSGTVDAEQRVEAAYGVADELRVDESLVVTEACYGCVPIEE